MTRKYLLILSIIGNVFCQQQSHFDTRTASLIHTSQQRTESSNNNNNNFNINNNPSAVPENSNLSVNNLNSNNPNPNNNFQESQFNNNNNNNPDQSGFNQQLQSDSSQPQQQNFGSQITLNTNEQEILPGGCSQGYECVPNFNCMNNTVIHDGVGILDSRFGDICTYPNMCCHLRQRRPSTLPPPFPTTQTPLVPHKCGRRNFDGVGTTIAENERDTQTYFGEFPWMVAVLRQEVLNTGQVINVYQCGGSIIDPLVILTAAHCVSGEHAGHFHIRAGEWDTQTTNESLPHQDRNVEQIVLHPDFQKASLANDIAILFLESPIQLADHIQTICLPPSTETFDYRNCYATGWGKDMFGQAGRHQVILKKIGLPVVPRDDCETTLRTTRLGKYFELHESFLCAGGELRKDTCKGDGGSPLTCPILGNTRQYYQAGIVAWGIGCGENNLPGVYTSVPNFREWIDRTIKSKGLDASNYAIN